LAFLEEGLVGGKHVVELLGQVFPADAGVQVPEDHRARRSPYVRIPAGRLGRPPSGGDDHARFPITMEIYTQVSSKSTREALKRLGESLDG
jgi:hypothetical protein